MKVGLSTVSLAELTATRVATCLVLYRSTHEYVHGNQGLFKATIRSLSLLGDDPCR